MTTTRHEVRKAGKVCLSFILNQLLGGRFGQRQSSWSKLVHEVEDIASHTWGGRRPWTGLLEELADRRQCIPCRRIWGQSTLLLCSVNGSWTSVVSVRCFRRDHCVFFALAWRHPSSCTCVSLYSNERENPSNLEVWKSTAVVPFDPCADNHGHWYEPPSGAFRR